MVIEKSQQTLQFEEFIGAKEVSELLSMRIETIWSLARSGKIPSYKIGGMRKFRLSEINNYIEECRIGKIK